MFKNYRKKPIVVQAKQWFPPGDERHDPSMVVERKGNQVNPPDYRQIGDLYCAMPVMPGFNPVAVYMIRTLEGDMKLTPGDWVIIGVKGEKYCCKPDVFEATYESVNMANNKISYELNTAAYAAENGIRRTWSPEQYDDYAAKLDQLVEAVRDMLTELCPYRSNECTCVICEKGRALTAALRDIELERKE